MLLFAKKQRDSIKRRQFRYDRKDRIWFGNNRNQASLNGDAPSVMIVKTVQRQWNQQFKKLMPYSA